MRIVFMGTPDFAVASLRRLVEDGHEICGVFTQPDKPKNRGMKMTFSPVKEYALSQNLANIAKMLTRKSCYFVPMTEDDPEKKPYSLIADIPSLHASIESALSGRQVMPLFV